MEILNAYSTYNQFISLIMLLTFAGTFILLGLALLNIIFKEFIDARNCFLVAIGCALILWGCTKWHPKTEVKHVEVIITDWNEVDFSKYEIESIRDKIVKLVEK